MSPPVQSVATVVQKEPRNHSSGLTMTSMGGRRILSVDAETNRAFLGGCGLRQ